MFQAEDDPNHLIVNTWHIACDHYLNFTFLPHKILILDDDADILELCSLILQTCGYETHTEDNCRNILDKVLATNPDVVLIDNWIPDIGGIASTKLIKANAATSHIPVVFFSASNHVEDFSKEAGADYFLQKPFDIGELERTIASAANKSKAMLKQDH